jgi:circadian clock protein KaiC
MELKHAAPGRAISTGIIGLDALLDGGYRQGTAVMITGPSGVGKTTVAATFARAACENGERVLYVNLEQSRESLVSCMRSPGIDLRAPIDEGALQILTSMPESMGVEEHLLRFYAAAGSFAPQHVVLDTVSACRRMGSEQDAFDFVMRLSDHCKRNGITCIMTDQANGHRAAESLGGYSLSSAVDGVLEISFGQDYKATGELSIRKYRGVNHARSAVSFSITNTGVVVHEPAAQAREAG